MQHRIGWLVLRCLVVAFLALGFPAAMGDVNAPDLPFGAVLFFVFGAAIQTQFSYRRALRRESWRGQNKNWSVPSWFTNPFSGEAHMMHMGANALVITGLASLLQSAVVGHPMLAGLFPLAAGWGLLLGNTAFFAFVYGKLKPKN